MATPTMQRTVADVLQDIAGNIQEIIHGEFRLARVELQEKARSATRPVTALATGLLIGIYGLGFLLLAAVYALGLVMAAWLAALLVGVVLSLVAAILISSGRTKLKHIEPVPHKTVETAKENIQWAKERMK